MSEGDKGYLAIRWVSVAVLALGKAGPGKEGFRQVR